MNSPFDPAEFVNKIGERLVFEFEHASVAGTPSLVGSARENPARKQIEKLLPGFVSVGSGLVFDSFGSFSKQQDIVLFERDFCPVYSINDTPDATYFPVEGVLATGEVKSVVDKSTLFDALEKVRSAKLARRFSEKTSSMGLPAAADFRPYGSNTTYAAVIDEEYNQETKYLDQLFGFIICKSFKNSYDSVLDCLFDFAQSYGVDHMPNFIVSLNDGFIQCLNKTKMSLQRSPLAADAFAFVPDKVRAFTFLVHELRRHAREGRSVPLYALDRYMASIKGKLPESRFRPFP